MDRIRAVIHKNVLPGKLMIQTVFHNCTEKIRLKLFDNRIIRWASILLLTWGVCLTYIWPRLFVSTPTGIYAGDRCIWGDWAGHMAGSAVFAFRPVSMWFKNHPLFYGVPYNYPFASDMISGLLMRMGFHPVPAFLIPSIITSLILLLALYFFYLGVLKSEPQAYLATTLFLLSGGLGFWYYFKDILHFPSFHTLFYPLREYSYLENKGIYFRNVIPGELLPQRSFLLGLPVGLLLLAQIRTWFSEERSKPSLLRCFLTGIPAGLLMIIHTHTYITMIIICLCIAIANVRSYKMMAAFALGAALISLWLYVSLYSQIAPSRMFGFLCGWKSNIAENGIMAFVRFWLINWGLVLPLALWGTVRMKYYRNPMVISGWVLFLLCNFVRFQPWDWDNTKILTWSYLLLVIPVTASVSSLWRFKKNVAKGAAIALVVILTFSGGLEVLKLIEANPTAFQMWNTDQINMASSLRKMLKPGETVLTDDDHLNWAPCLAGGQILMGFRGWLWSYGIGYLARENDVRTMYSGKPEADVLFKKYHVQYAVLTPSARSNFKANELLFLLKYKMVLKDNDTSVYDVTKLRR